ncbi:MAG: family 20 glycosylhydrolase [Lentisphaeria bacterium]|nr:family 20 glycosylhydrolase [Lentisphaeria bacterium]
MKSTENVFPINMRIAQFYMARHKVSIEWAEKFIDYAASLGFNYINVCIYGCIRTEVFHHMPEKDSYSKEEIRRMVKYASDRGIEIIPNYELFGHAESFLECPEFEHLCELRNGIKGRFSNLKESFCPSVEETYEFIEAYLRETTELFPGKYINAGLDENFDMALCPECAGWAEREGRAAIHEYHIKRIHDIIVNKLGKTMMMWDDSLESYPEAFEKFPKDIIMLSWWYGRMIPEHPHTGGAKMDYFEFHEKHGFRYIGVPATYHFQNIEAFTEYAKKYRPMGMLLSNWGKMTRYNAFPMMAYAAALWKDGMDSAEAQKKVVRDFCSPENDIELEILRHHFREGEHNKLPANPAIYTNDTLNYFEYSKSQQARILFPLVKKELEKAAVPHCKCFFHELFFWQRCELWYYQLREILGKWGNPKAEFNDWTALKALKEEISTANDEMIRWYQEEYRCPMPEYFTVNDTVAMLEKILNGTTKRPAARLKITYPYRLGLGAMEYFIRGEGETEWHSIGKSNGHSFYQFYDDCQESVSYLFIDENLPVPAEVKILYTECGSGLCSYVMYENADSVYVPSAIQEVSGVVTMPENLLSEGRYYSQFGDGERLTIEKLNRPHVPENNSVVLKFSRKD